MSTEKASGATGQMILQEDGAILSSSGELASHEATSAHLMNLTRHAFSAAPLTQSSVGNEGPVQQGTQRWNRISVVVGPSAYSATLSNRKVFVTKRDISNSSTQG